MIRHVVAFFALIVVVSCSHNHKPLGNTNALSADSTYQPSYARGFKIDYVKGQRVITLYDPFDTLRAPQTICVTNYAAERPAVAADQTICAEDPRWVALSSTHISPANLLGIKNSIIGVAEPHYISDSLVRARVSEGRIRNVGMAMSPDLEVIIAVKPKFVMVSPFPDISYSQIRHAGIAVVPNASYLENTPLARAEWLVFVAALFGKEATAVKLFKGIETRYNQLKVTNKAISRKPTLFTGNFYQGVWYASKGQNYMATYFADAGADYIYKKVEGTGTLNLEFEQIFNDAHQAEYWLLILNHQGDVTYDVVKQIDPRYEEFQAFKSRKIIFTNANTSMFFEEAEQRPDVVLADITYALHPDRMPDYQPVYFKLLR